MRPLGAGRIALAALAALALHGAMALALFWRPPAPGAAAAGEGGLTVGLGQAGARAAAVAPAAPAVMPAVAPAVAPRAAPALAPPQRVATDTPAAPARAAAQPASAAPAATAAAAPSRTAVAAAPPPTVAVAPDAAMAAPPSAVAALAPATAPGRATTPSPSERARPPDAARPQRRPAGLSPARLAAPTRAAAALAAPQGEGADAETERAPGRDVPGGTNSGAGTGVGDTARAGGDPGARQDYFARLQAHFSRHKRYPRRAQRRRQEGTGQVFVRIDAAGRVLTASLRQGTGHALLDMEIMKMVSRAEPLPAIPPELGVSTVDLVLPVGFTLR